MAPEPLDQADDMPDTIAKTLQHDLDLATKFGHQLAQVTAAYEVQLASLRNTVQRARGKLQEHADEAGGCTASGPAHSEGESSNDSVDYAMQTQTTTFLLPEHTADTTLSVNRTDSQSVRNFDIELLPTWEGRICSSKTGLTHSASFESFQEISLQGDSTIDPIIGCLVLRPTSPLLLSWDILSVLTVAYDVLTLPLIVFDFDNLKAVAYMRLLTSTVWTIDLMLSFFVGYYNPTGDVELRFTHTARRYLKTWFTMDFLLVTMDWVILLLEKSTVDAFGVARIAKTFRFTRIIRMLRLIRVVKFMGVIEGVIHFVESEGLLTYLGVLKLLCGLALFSHFVACGFYGIGTTAGDRRDSWFWSLEEEGASTVHKYVVSFRWALAQYTPAPTDYHPRSFYEQGYALFVTFFGIMVFSTFMGLIVTAMSNLQKMLSKREMQKIMLRRYIREQSLPLELANQLLSIRVRPKRTVPEIDLELLKQLPETLVLQMHYHIYKNTLALHPLFLQLRSVHQHALVDICNEAMSQVDITKQTEFFSYGKDCAKMLFVHSGCLDYLVGPPQARSRKRTDMYEEVTEGAWLCEPAVWCKWTHRGQLVARQHCRIMELHASALQVVANKHPRALCFFKVYSKYWSQMIADNFFLLYDTSTSGPAAQELADYAFEHLEEEPDVPPRLSPSFKNSQRDLLSAASRTMTL